MEKLMESWDKEIGKLECALRKNDSALMLRFLRTTPPVKVAELTGKTCRVRPARNTGPWHPRWPSA
jgi:hypothetical protein